MHTRRTYMLVSAAALVAVFCTAPAMAECYVFYPTDDAFVAQKCADCNTGSQLTLCVRNPEGATSGWELSTLIKFDLSSLPEDVNVVSATLYLYYWLYEDNDPEGRELTCRRLTEDWDEDTLTFNNQPDRSEQVTSEAVVPDAYGWMDWDLTSGVESFLEDPPVDNYGWIITDEEDYGAVNIPVTNFRSKEYGSVIPYLVVEMAWDPCQTDKLTAYDAAAADWFGFSVCVDGRRAVMGAPGDDDEGNFTGAAYVFKRDADSWDHEAKLTASDASAGDFFGRSVCISGDYIVVGAMGVYNEARSAGAAYVFKRSGVNWSQQAKLLPDDPAEDAYFGISVSIDGDYIAVGAYGDDEEGSYTGAVYVFKRDGEDWDQQTKLLADDAAGGDYFGYSVSICGDRLLVGAYGDSDDGSDSGSAYVFHRSDSTWSQEDKLTAGDAAAGDWFGRSVSLCCGNLALVGAPRNDDAGTDSGSAYVFSRNGTDWSQEQKLLPSDGAADDLFGESVTLYGDYAVVGAQQHDDAGSEAGAAHLFRWDGDDWIEQDKLVGDDTAAGDWFGYAVSMDSETLLVGAPYDDGPGGSDAGSGYIFRQCECLGDINGDGYRNITDYLLFMEAYPSQCGDDDYNPDADLNCDCFVNLTDYTIFMEYYLEPCP